MRDGLTRCVRTVYDEVEFVKFGKVGRCGSG